MSFLVRSSQSTDLIAIHDLITQNQCEIGQDVLSFDTLLDYYFHRDSRPFGHFWVCVDEINGLVCGCVGLKFESLSESRVCRLMTRNLYKNGAVDGIEIESRLMVNLLEFAAKQKSYERVLATVIPEKVPIYEHLGFTLSTNVSTINNNTIEMEFILANHQEKLSVLSEILFSPSILLSPQPSIDSSFTNPLVLESHSEVAFQYLQKMTQKQRADFALKSKRIVSNLANATHEAFGADLFCCDHRARVLTSQDGIYSMLASERIIDSIDDELAQIKVNLKFITQEQTVKK